jgi:hypothetical protein
MCDFPLLAVSKRIGEISYFIPVPEMAARQVVAVVGAVDTGVTREAVRRWT